MTETNMHILNMICNIIGRAEFGRYLYIATVATSVNSRIGIAATATPGITMTFNSPVLTTTLDTWLSDAIISRTQSCAPTPPRIPVGSLKRSTGVTGGRSERSDQWRSRNVYLVASALELIGPSCALPRFDVIRSAACTVAKYRIRGRALRVGETDGRTDWQWTRLLDLTDSYVSGSSDRFANTAMTQTFISTLRQAAGGCWSLVLFQAFDSSGFGDRSCGWGPLTGTCYSVGTRNDVTEFKAARRWFLL